MMRLFVLTLVLLSNFTLSFAANIDLEMDADYMVGRDLDKIIGGINKQEEEDQQDLEDAIEAEKTVIDNAVGYIAHQSASIITAIEIYSIKTYKNISKGYHGLYTIIAIIFVTLFVMKIVYSSTGARYIDVINMIKMALSIVIVSALVFSPPLFESLYKTIAGTVIKLADFFLSTGGTLKDVEGDTPLEQFINHSGGAFTSMILAAQAYSANASILSSPLIWFFSMILMVLAIIIFLISVTTLLMALISANIMVALMPIGLSLLPFERTRFLGRNNIMLFFIFSSAAIIIAIILGMIMSYVSTEISSLIPKEGAEIVEKIDKKSFIGFFMKSLFLMFLTCGLVMSSREIASGLFSGGASMARNAGGARMARKAGMATARGIGFFAKKAIGR